MVKTQLPMQASRPESATPAIVFSPPCRSVLQ